MVGTPGFSYPWAAPSSLWASVSHLEGAGVGPDALGGPLTVIPLPPMPPRLLGSPPQHVESIPLPVVPPTLSLLFQSCFFTFPCTPYGMVPVLCYQQIWYSPWEVCFRVSGGGGEPVAGYPGCTRTVSLWVKERESDSVLVEG